MGQDALRIAMFSDSALPVLNGVSVSIDALVRELRQAGHSVHIFTAAHFGYKDPDPNTYRFPAIETPWTKGYPLAFPPFYPLLQHFRRNRFDVVHTHTPWTIGFVGLRWAQSEGVPVVSTYHTHYDKYTHYIPFVPKRYLRYKIAKHTNYYYNAVDHVITPSEASAKWLGRHSVRTPVTVIPTGNLPRQMLDRAELRLQHKVPVDARILLYVGRLAEEKNMGVLFEAAAQALAQDHRAVFWLVGDGPYREECAEMARALGIGDRVRFVGFVDRHQVDAYYELADIFIFASMTETQGLVIQEAMSYGLPSVVVQGGGASSAIENGVNGIIVGNDATQLSNAVVSLLEDEGYYSAISKEASRSARTYSTRDMTEDVLTVYDQAIHGVKRRSRDTQPA
ncbi:MAG: glycosyltransferase [Chthonomonas sp.]|nr:glycosyltransferase [Chthonomonas sp.]